jgi:hypothetical protein
MDLLELDWRTQIPQSRRLSTQSAFLNRFEASEIVREYPLPQFGLRRSEAFAAHAQECCVSEGGKPKVGFVPHLTSLFETLGTAAFPEPATSGQRSKGRKEPILPKCCNATNGCYVHWTLK